MKTLKIKLLFAIVSGFLIGTSAVAQSFYSDPAYGPDSASRKECAMNLSIMSEYVKIKSYDLAYDAWSKCFKECPASSKNIYLNGAKIIKHKIENAPDEETQSVWVDTLMFLYDKRMEHFQQKGYVYGHKGIDLLRYRKEDAEIAYSYLEKSVDLREDKVDESVAITFISTTYALMQQGVLGPDVMINNYMKVMDLLEEKVASGDKDRRLPQAIESIEKIFAESGAADCESLISIFTPKFTESPDDVELLKKVTSLLSETGCEDSELYAQTAEKLFALEPSAESAAKLGGLFAIKQDYNKAKDYYTQAVNQATEDEPKATYYYQLAKVAFQQKDYPEVRKNCLAAINLKSNYGEAYILIGSAYAASSSTCGESAFEKQSVYWAAVDKFQKAKSVDPTVKEVADEQIKAYSSRFPNNEDAFFNNYTDGQTYKVGCWINENTTVRTTK